ncbi:hypothetical protein HNR59_001846 [Aquamicrobium lusatiense]|uniref:Uncharacterized protein n=1 Tax=Aquamicrobium lusatiense TaxID=89772 RepID=A0A7W9S1R0_9HYPH|nr:hypothetical protein [Aquamicrobium lusatiense]
MAVLSRRVKGQGKNTCMSNYQLGVVNKIKLHFLIYEA